MTARIAYYRVSTADQSIESQRLKLLQAAGGEAFGREFTDEGVSGAIPAAQRPGFADLLRFVREGDTVYVYAVDRLGRDAIDVQATVRGLVSRGVSVHVLGLGSMGPGVGELILAVLAQVADMERKRIAERTAAGRENTRKVLAEGGTTKRGRLTMGRPRGALKEGRQVDPVAVAQWRRENGASIAATAQHFSLSEASVKRYCRPTSP